MAHDINAARLTRRRPQLRDVAAVAAVTIAFLILTPWWSGLDTPDSEFYASLAIFTDQITDRAPIDSYFWTRLGYIAPVHALISVLGIWGGFAAYKALLLAIITASTFTLTRRSTGFWRATWLTAAAVASSVLVAYLGNPYITGTIMAGTAALAALATFQQPAAAIASGAVLGWMAMAYPGGALLGGSIWIALLIYRTRTTTNAHPISTFISAALTTLISLAAFWMAGRALFPGLDWLGTYIEASSFDYSRYSSGEWVWLRDISLLVPLSVPIIAIINVITHKKRQQEEQERRRTQVRAAEWALLISATSIGFILAYSPFFGAHFLEAPPSQAMLWPPAMIAIALIAASRMPDDPTRSSFAIVIAIIGLTAIIIAGRIDPNLPLAAGWLIAIALIALVVITPQRTIATLIATTVFLTGAQLLQNSREPLGQFMLDPYAWAYQGNPNEQKIRTAVNAQQWLLDNTTEQDQILLWVDGPWMQGDRELYTVASMQLWGDNRVTLEPTLTDEYGINALNSIKPNVIAMYGKSMDAINTFYESVPRERQPTTPICYDYTWPIDPVSDFPTTVGHTCLTRLSW